MQVINRRVIHKRFITKTGKPLIYITVLQHYGLEDALLAAEKHTLN